jgi:hypothetical protein
VVEIFGINISNLLSSYLFTLYDIHQSSPFSWGKTKNIVVLLASCPKKKKKKKKKKRKKIGFVFDEGAGLNIFFNGR